MTVELRGENGIGRFREGIGMFILRSKEEMNERL